MSEIKVFVDIKEDLVNKILISRANAQKLGVSSGASVEIFNPDNGKKATAPVEVSDTALDFAAIISRNLMDAIEFAGIEVILRTIGGTAPAPQPAMLSQPKLQAPQPHLPGHSSKSTPSPTPSYQPPPQPTPSYQPPPQPTPSYQPPPQPTPSYQPPPQPTPSYQPPPQPTPSYQPPPQLSTPPGHQMPAYQSQQADPYQNQISASMLQGQKNGVILTPVINDSIVGGRVQLSYGVLQRLGLAQGLLVAWEDPLTRATGSARVDQGSIADTQIAMSRDTKEDTYIKADQIVVYSTETPIQKASQLMLQVQSQPNLSGSCQVSPRTQHTLSIQTGDVLAFEDELTGAIGACKVRVTEGVQDRVIVIDSEILEASGVGSFEVKVFKNQKHIISLQSVSLGISPISGENMWEIVSNARQSVVALKDWLKNYTIFKGIKLRWNAANIACSIVSCVPDLTGDVLAQITDNTTVSLAPTGLIPFNAILIIDISRSMMARDVLVTNIAPAIEGIKAAMESREIQEFLKNFKEGVYIPQRISAAFAAVLFLSEKVGRGFGEKVSVIRFADDAQILPFGDGFYMDSASGEKGVLEQAARLIVDRIGNAYGQATNMGKSMEQARFVFNEFNKISRSSPTMIVLLTDGEPTDGDAFFNSISQFANDPNLVLYIVGLGNPNDELMTRAASLCGGEYFKPEDAGELLIWYSKRARDLTVKLKAHK